MTHSSLNFNIPTPSTDPAALVDEYLEMVATNGVPPVAQQADDDIEPSPLDIEPAKNLELGWIDEYTDLVTQMTGSPREFNQLGALVTVATAIQRKARLRMAFGDIYPNIFACIVAPSSVYHKTSSLSRVRTILSRAFMEDLLLADQVTPEGLVKQLSRRPEGLVLRDEIGTLFASHRVKYLATLKQDLTRLYDNEPWRKELSNESITVERPYLNLFGATTPSRFYDSVSMMDWRDGFIVRWLFVLPENEPDFDSMTGMYDQRYDARIGELAMQLANIGKQDHTDFLFTGNAHELWDTWQRESARTAYYYDSEIAAPLVMRYSTYALKFAMILAAINGSWGTITPETMQTAMDLADSYKRYVHRLMSEKSEHQVSGGKLQKIFAVIKKKFPETYGKGVTTKTIQQFSGMKSAQAGPCLEKLVEIGAIAEEQAGRGKRYIPMAETLPVKGWK